MLAKGAGTTENTWNLDGIPVTDLASTGSSPTYYNFDMFQEMSVTTGGASGTNPTAGAQLNMQFKGGSNRVMGNAHYYGAGESLQSTNLPDELLPLAGPSGKGNRLKEIRRRLRCRRPARARQVVGMGIVCSPMARSTLNGDPDRTKLETLRSRPRRNWAIGSGQSSCSSAATRRRTAAAQAAALRADDVGSDGPTPLYKARSTTRRARTCS